MKQRIQILAQNQLFQMLMAGVFGYTALMAMIIAVLQVPPEAILNSGLEEILMVFEG